MAKKKKSKFTVSDAKQPGLAKKSATRPNSPPVLAGRPQQAVVASDAGPRSTLVNEQEKVAASSDVPSAPPPTSTARQVDVTLGQIVTILMRSPQHKERPLADLEWLVLPAILSGQSRVAQAQQSGIAVPVGVALWASISGFRICPLLGAYNLTSGAQAISHGSGSLLPIPQPRRRF